MPYFYWNIFEEDSVKCSKLTFHSNHLKPTGLPHLESWQYSGLNGKMSMAQYWPEFITLNAKVKLANRVIHSQLLTYVD